MANKKSLIFLVLLGLTTYASSAVDSRQSTVDRIDGGMIFLDSDMVVISSKLEPGIWNRKSDVLTQVPGKYVKGGGALTAVGDSFLYAFRGNKSNEFYKYIIARDSWARMESMPFGYRPGTSIINKKRINRGAALCYDGDNTIYATKGYWTRAGIGTKEFWAYRINDMVLPETTLPGNTWHAKEFSITAKGLKSGTALVYKDSMVYLLAGSQRAINNNFYVYYVDVNAWATLAKAPLAPDDKVYRCGSSLAIIDRTIYALKGGGKNGYKHNYFYTYDITDTTWTYNPTENIPLVHPQLGRKTKVKEGAAMATNGSVIYAIKGGGRQDFWKYTPGTPAGIWTPLDIIPKLNNKSVPKSGAALAYADGKVYLLKGNNTPEFWEYIPLEKSKSQIPSSKQIQNSNVQIQTSSERIAESGMRIAVNPNPFTKLTTIRYTVPISSKVSIKLYNTTGRVVKTLIDESKNVGNYQLTLNTNNLSAGVYFLSLETEKQRITERLIIIK